MCGIAGLSGVLDRPIAEVMGDVIAHRGPDWRGSWDDSHDRIHLFHQRLSVIDLSSAAHQPMVTSDGRYTIVYNGEIYNFLDLRKVLSAKGRKFRTNSDTEVVLQAFQEWGHSFLEKLNGIFAFALWDSHNKTLLLARDPQGVKPLYIAQNNGNFAFCSEIKGLKRMFPALTELDHDAIRRYFTFIYCPGEGTPLKGVTKLDPGSAVLVRDGAIIKRWTYYEPPFLSQTPVRQSSDEINDALDEALRKAVGRQMIADVKLGAFLSGGVDSSTIVAYAREVNPEIECFTIRTPGGRDAGETDDLAYATRTASHLGVNLNVIDVTANSLSADIDKMIWYLDEPIADPASLNTFYIAEAARKQGIKVLLSGTGGDDLFSGYRRHQALMIGGMFDRLPAMARRLLSVVGRALPARGGFARRRDKLLQILNYGNSDALPSYFVWALDQQLDRLFINEGVTDPQSVMNSFLATSTPGLSPLQKMLALEQRYFLADHNLNYTDKMGMAASTEIRVPFLDHELVEFAARIPDSHRVKWGGAKIALKVVASRRLPKEIVTRPKTGFGVPLRRWLKEELRDYVNDTLCVDRIKRRGIFRPDYVQELLAWNETGQRDVSYTLFSLLCLEVWFEKYLDDGV